MIRVLLLGIFVALAGLGAVGAQTAAAPAVTTAAPTTTVSVPVVAQPSGGFLDVGAAFGKLRPYVDSAVGSLVSVALGWLFFLVRTKLNLSIDQGHRDALTAFLLRQASSLVADGFVMVSGLKVTVDSAALRNAALLGEQVVGDAVKFFGLTPASIAERIVDKLPQVPAVASAMATTTATATTTVAAVAAAAAIPPQTPLAAK